MNSNSGSGGGGAVVIECLKSLCRFVSLGRLFGYDDDTSQRDYDVDSNADAAGIQRTNNATEQAAAESAPASPTKAHALRHIGKCTQLLFLLFVLGFLLRCTLCCVRNVSAIRADTYARVSPRTFDSFRFCTARAMEV